MFVRGMQVTWSKYPCTLVLLCLLHANLDQCLPEAVTLHVVDSSSHLCDNDATEQEGEIAVHEKLRQHQRTLLIVKAEQTRRAAALFPTLYEWRNQQMAAPKQH